MKTVKVSVKRKWLVLVKSEGIWYQFRKVEASSYEEALEKAKDCIADLSRPISISNIKVV